MQIKLTTENTQNTLSHPQALTVDAHRTLGWNIQSGSLLGWDVTDAPRFKLIKGTTVEDMMDEVNAEPFSSEYYQGGEAQEQVVQPSDMELGSDLRCDELEADTGESVQEESDMVGLGAGGLDQCDTEEEQESSDIPLIEVNLT